MSGFDVNYSWSDRMLHKLLMSQLELQKPLSKLEDRLFADTCTGIEAAEPVFITSLPRAGTTLLLEVLAATPGFVTHTYREMPMLLCPMLWHRVSRAFRKQGQARERAHGDGLLVDYDSVEAFEEVLWRAFWPEHFEDDRIRPWSADEIDDEDEFADFLRQHMRKLVGLRRATQPTARRYVSKNNANIARLAWLQRQFPDATVVVPYREPRAQIGSLMRQHRRFLEMHAQDDFVLSYMESIGHLEFGQALRPIDFDGWLDRTDADPTSAAFWADYWVAAFRAVLADLGPRCVLVGYDRLCTQPAQGLPVLAEHIGLEADALATAVDRFRPATGYDDIDLPPARSDALADTLAELDRRALI